LFRIYDGREQFYQWDLDRKLIVEDATITEVHFCNRTGDCSLVCEPYTENGLTVVNVPNILLQTDWKIRVYAYAGYTKHEANFEVVGRTKPADYIYHEVELKELVGKQERDENGEIVGEIFNDFVENAATGGYAHAEGKTSIASGWCSHAEGAGGVASGKYSHAENMMTTAEGNQSHAEGWSTLAQGVASHAEGYKTQALGLRSHSEGSNTKAKGSYTHAEGADTEATGNYSHAEGHGSITLATNSHAEGYKTETGKDANGAHAEGGETKAHGAYSHSEGHFSQALGEASHAEGHCTIASGKYQHVQGKYNIEDENGTYAHIVGNGYNDNGNVLRRNIHTLDWNGNGWYSGNVFVGENKKELATKSYADEKQAETLTLINNEVNNKPGKPGTGTNADVFNDYKTNIASGEFSHAEGSNTQATGRRAHAEGAWTRATGNSSHAEGNEAKAHGDYSHAEGLGTIASQKYQHVQGRYNKEDTENKYIHIVGNGYNNTERRNIHTLDWNGNGWYEGYVEANYFILKSADGTRWKIKVTNGGLLTAERA
jgi:hypothetical protein